MGVLHAEKEDENDSQEDRKLPLLTYSDNTSNLAASSIDLILRCHRTSALDHLS
jgi:hypothetical protein